MIVYRKASRDDAATLDRLFDRSFCDTFAHLYRPEDLESFLSSFSVEDWAKQIDDPAYAFRIADVDGESIGYVKLGPLKLPVETERRTILLDQLYILKPHHGAGIAQELMDWALAEARRRDAEEMYLTVFTENHRARRFYERYGFEYIGPYKFMVGNHADEDIIMRKRL
jgi:GNAT superfamily N-acetyltransferase